MGATVVDGNEPFSPATARNTSAPTRRSRCPSCQGSLSGSQRTLPVGEIGAGDFWSPTPIGPVVVNLL